MYLELDFLIVSIFFVIIFIQICVFSIIVITELKKLKKNSPPIKPRGRDGDECDDGGRMQRTERSIIELSTMIGNTYDLPQKDNSEQKFSSRCRLYVSNFADVTVQEVTEMFEKYGEINECFVNPEKMFAFVRLDYRANAERAKRELNGFERGNRALNVRFAPARAAIKVKNLTQWVTNELLEYAFSIFGEIKRARVLVDVRGNSLKEGIVEFTTGLAALSALRRCTEGCFFLTSSSRPVILEPYDVIDNVDGFPEKSITPTPTEYMKARDIRPTFATNSSFEFEYGTRWKQLHDLYKQKEEALKRELKLEEEKLEREKSAMELGNSKNNIMDRIPNIILTKILSHLSAPYMKQARLVCKRWYEASKDILIMKHQKFVFRKYESPGILLNTLAKGNYSCYNLLIHGRSRSVSSTDERFDSFVESQGSKIYTLRFENLTVNSSTIEKIFFNCIHLNELAFKHCNFDNISSVNTIPTVNDVQIIDIERKTLKILKINACVALSYSLFKLFINVYHNVEKLSFVPIFSFGNVHDVCKTIAEKCKNIKTLKLKPYNELRDDDLGIIASTACFKLKELNISEQQSLSKYNHDLQTGIKNFLSQQPNIISLNVSGCDIGSTSRNPQANFRDFFGFKCIEYLLFQNGIDLEHVNIDIAVWPDIPDLLRNRRLKSFHCNIISRLANTENSIVMNRHLEELSINASFCHSILPILKSFPNLTYLKLSGLPSGSTTPAAASFIFTHLVHLETIILEGCSDWVNDSAFENSTGKLKNLKHLNLHGCEKSGNGIKNFYYPKLKYLNIQCCFGPNGSVGSALPHLAETSPLLEYLHADYDSSVSYELSSNKTWKYLRYLYLRKDGSKVDEDLMHRISQWKGYCPSLHYICIYLILTGRRFTFTYNPESKQFDGCFL